MLKILELIAKKRIENNENNFTIQLSSLLMSKAVDDVNLKKGLKIQQNGMTNDVKLILQDKEFRIHNKAYRDDTNDQDVEEILYELAMQNK
mgnify:FL=1